MWYTSAAMASERLRTMFHNLLVRRFWNSAFTHGRLRTWGREPIVRRRINQRITGSPDQWPMDWLVEYLGERRFPRALSLGCGEGALERDLMAKGLCGSILGLDLSDQALDLARQRAAEAGYPTVDYQLADLDRLQLDEGAWDAVFVHQALHHVRALEDCLRQVAAALPADGLLYLDEYVGPSRHEWDRQLLAAAESAYQELPAAIRRRRRLQLPVDRWDPSEAVRASEILPMVRQFFDIQEQRDYGGHLLSVIHPHLRLEVLDEEAREEVLNQLLAREDELLASGATSFYTVIVARPATSSVTR